MAALGTGCNASDGGTDRAGSSAGGKYREHFVKHVHGHFRRSESRRDWRIRDLGPRGRAPGHAGAGRVETLRVAAP